MSSDYSTATVSAPALARVPTSTTRLLAALGLGAALVFSLTWGCGSFGIQDNNEGLYAEVAREMLARGDWIVPHLNGVPYLEKPPLLYWLVASLLHVFGPHEWVIRLAPALCFAGAAAGLLSIGRMIGRTATGRGAAIMLASATGSVLMGRSLLFDGPLMCVLTWFLACFLRWRLTGSRRSLRAAYALLGLGVMTKGMIALVFGVGAAVGATVLACLAATTHEPLQRRRRSTLRDVLALFDWTGALLFVAVAAPWHVAAAIRQPGFVDFYFINEHVRRFLGTRLPHDFYTGPVYYYLVRLPMYLGIWSFALLLVIPFGAQRFSITQRGPIEARRLCTVVVALALAFFSLSEGKANYYLLSVAPALCLLIALRWPEDGMRSRRLFLAPISIGVLALVYAVAARCPVRRPDVAMLLRPHSSELALVATLLAIVALAAWPYARRAQNRAVFWLTAIAGLVTLWPLPRLLESADPLLSQRSLAQFLVRDPSQPVLFYREYEKLSSLPFYLAHPVPVVDCTSDELYYPQRHTFDPRTFVDDAALSTLVRSGPVWLVTTPRRAAEAQARFADLHAEIVRTGPSSVLLRLGARPTHTDRIASANPWPRNIPVTVRAR